MPALFPVCELLSTLAVL